MLLKNTLDKSAIAHLRKIISHSYSHDEIILLINDSQYCFRLEINLLQTVVDLFNAGCATYTPTISTAIFYLIKYPNVQDKCRKEINKVKYIYIKG